MQGQKADVMFVPCQGRLRDVAAFQKAMANPVNDRSQYPLTALGVAWLCRQTDQGSHLVKRRLGSILCFQLHQQFNAFRAGQYPLVAIQRRGDEVCAQTARAAVFFVVAWAIGSGASYHRQQPHLHQFLRQACRGQFLAARGFCYVFHSCNLHAVLDCCPAQRFMLLLHGLAAVEGLHPELRLRCLREGARHAQQDASPFVSFVIPSLSIQVILGPDMRMSTSMGSVNHG